MVINSNSKVHKVHANVWFSTQLIVTARYTRYMLMCGLAHTINSNSKVHK